MWPVRSTVRSIGSSVRHIGTNMMHIRPIGMHTGATVADCIWMRTITQMITVNTGTSFGVVWLHRPSTGASIRRWAVRLVRYAHWVFRKLRLM